jgi:hypothetical protein
MPQEGPEKPPISIPLANAAMGMAKIARSL